MIKTLLLLAAVALSAVFAQAGRPASPPPAGERTFCPILHVENSRPPTPPPGPTAAAQPAQSAGLAELAQPAQSFQPAEQRPDDVAGLAIAKGDAPQPPTPGASVAASTKPTPAGSPESIPAGLPESTPTASTERGPAGLPDPTSAGSPASTPTASTQRGPAAQPAPTAGRRFIHMRVTAYCPCPRCCGRWADGVTASGQPVTADGGRFVAADPKRLPLGTRLIVPGYAAGPVRVLDTGGAIRGNRLDVFFPTHRAALAWGVRHLDIEVVDQP